MLKVVARQGKNLYLVQTDEDKEKSRVWDDKDKEWRGEAFNTNSILARGYWHGVEGLFLNTDTKKVVQR